MSLLLDLSAALVDVTQLIPLIDAIPPIRGVVGEPRRRPRRLYSGAFADAQIMPNCRARASGKVVARAVRREPL